MDDPEKPLFFFLQVVVLEVRNLKSVGDSEIIYCTMEVDSSGSSKCTSHSLAPPISWREGEGQDCDTPSVNVIKIYVWLRNSQPRHMGGRTYRLGPASKK